MIIGVCRLIANHLHLAIFESTPEVRVLPSTGITRPQRSYDPVRTPPMPPPKATLRPLPSHQTGLPRLPEPPFRRAAPTTPADRAGAHVDCFPASHGLPQMAGGSASALSLSRPAQALLTLRPAGSLSRPQATFVTRLQPLRLPAQAARQLPDQSTTLRVDSSSTDDSRLRGALPIADIGFARKRSRRLGARLVGALRFRGRRCEMMLGTRQAVRCRGSFHQGGLNSGTTTRWYQKEEGWRRDYGPGISNAGNCC